MSISSLFRGPNRYDESLRLGPLEAAVIVRNGKPEGVRRSGKYRRFFGSSRLGLFGDLQIFLFHTGEVPISVTVPAVPLGDDMSLDCTVHMGVRLTGADATLLALASRFTPQNFVRAAEAECTAVAKKLVFEALTLARHEDLQRASNLEGMFRAGSRILEGVVEIVAVRQIVPKWDEVALTEAAERKAHALEIARGNRSHEISIRDAQRRRELQEYESATRRQIRLYETTTSALTDEIRMSSRARIASLIGQKLGVPPWWVFNPEAYTAELAGNQKLLTNILGEFGSEFAMVADQFGLSRLDFLKMFGGLQSKVLEIIDDPKTGLGGIEGNANSRFAHSEVVLSALRSHGLEIDAAGSWHTLDGGILRAVVVAQNIGETRSKVDEIQSELATQTGAMLTNLAIAPYESETAGQVAAIAQTIIAEEGIDGLAAIRHLEGDNYVLALDELGYEVFAPWKPAVDGVFKPSLNIRLERP